jgi:hypothetical protein
MAERTTSHRASIFSLGLTAVAVLAAACGGSTPDGTPTLEVACSGASCGAASPSLYAGSGVGIWRFRNDSGQAAKIDIGIGGVVAGQAPVLLFSNGSSANTNLPSFGAAPAPAASLAAMLPPGLETDADLRAEARHRAEWEMTERNRELAISIGGLPPVAPSGLPAPLAAAPAPQAPPVIGTTTRTWNDTSDTLVVAYPNVVVRDVCALPGGRSAIFWIDPAAWGTSVTSDLLTYFKNTVCGSTGGYARIRSLRGEPWGDKAASDQRLIQEAQGALLDVNIVFLSVPEAKQWGGYFHSFNSFKKTVPDCAKSNEALAVFINATQVGNPRTGGRNYASTLLHEMTHLVNFYQRSLIQDSPYDTWLEEMSAMMSEDLITPTVTEDGNFPTPAGFIQPYVKDAGGVSLINWGYLGSAFYDLGGSLGAFLNRRYGTAVYTDMVKCSVFTDMTGHECVDSIIRARGGAGLEDEFARLGATLYGLLPVTGTPEGFGFPARTGDLPLKPIDVSAYALDRKAAKELDNGFQATSHTYLLDAVPAGSTTYSRTGVVVPPGSSLLVVIQPPVAR